MPTQRLSMRRIKQLLTMHFGAGASTRAIGRELGIAPSTVREYLGRATAAGIGWPLAAEVTDESLVARLFANAGVRAGARFHAEPDWPSLVRELKRPGVNLLVLWDEYRAVHPEGYAYSRFCQLFREFERRLSPTMRQQHVAGDKAFVDYSGKRVPIADPATGEVRPAGARNTFGIPGRLRRNPQHQHTEILYIFAMGRQVVVSVRCSGSVPPCKARHGGLRCGDDSGGHLYRAVSEDARQVVEVAA